MKEKGEKTKVIVRNLPPSLAENSFLEILDKFLCNRYSWSWFCQGKSRQSRQLYSRAYVNLKSHEDVLSLYDNIDGRVFINERGVQYKAMVEYAPFQRVPKPRIKKDARDGTIYKDADYAAFLESLEKVQEMLPSAEVQLERREAEKAAAVVAGGGKEPVIVTPLMEFVRNKRAAKSSPVPRALATRQPKSSAAATGSSQKKERFRGDADKERASGEKRRKDPLSEGKERRVPKDFSPGSVNSKSAAASGYSHLRVDDDSAQPPSSSSSTLAEAAAGGGGSRGGSMALPSPSSTAHLAISTIVSADGGPCTPTPAKESGRREGSKRQRQREREREKEAAAIAVAAAVAATAAATATATATAGAGAGSAGDGAPKSPATATAASLHSPHGRASQRAPVVHKVVESSSAASRPQLSSHHHHHHQHHHDAVGGTTQAGLGSSTSHGSEASSESRRLRNKDRPDRPVWTPRRRGDSAPVPAAAAAAGGSNSMTTSVGSGGGKGGGGSAAVVGQGIPLQPGSITILRRDSRKAGISGQGQQSPGTEQAVTAGDGNVENSGGPCGGISLSSLGPSTLAPSPSVMPSSSSSSAPAAAPARGRSGGKKGGHNVQQQQMLNTTVLMAGPSPADPSQGGVKGVEVASGRRGGRGGRVTRNAGDSVNPSATSSSAASSDHYPHRDGGGGGGGRKVEGSKNGVLGKSSNSSAAAKDGSGWGAGSTNGHNGMPPS